MASGEFIRGWRAGRAGPRRLALALALPFMLLRSEAINDQMIRYSCTSNLGPSLVWALHYTWAFLFFQKGHSLNFITVEATKLQSLGSRQVTDRIQVQRKD